jgi:D-alanine--poly(phosphoribitol) ligase subunit 1
VPTRRASPGTALVLSGHKQIEFVVAMLGCLRLGVTYVPLDSINPPQRLQRIIELVGAGHCYDAEQDQFRAGGLRRAAGRSGPGLRHVHLRQHRRPQGRADRPRQPGAVRRLDPRLPGLGRTPRFMNQMLFSFDFSLFDLWGRWPWVASVLCPREVIGDPEGFVDYLADSQVQVWASTPSFVRQQLLNDAFDASTCPPCRCSCSAPSR